MRGRIRVLRFILFPPYPHLLPVATFPQLPCPGRTARKAFEDQSLARPAASSRSLLASVALHQPSLGMSSSLCWQRGTDSPESASLQNPGAHPCNRRIALWNTPTSEAQNARSPPHRDVQRASRILEPAIGIEPMTSSLPWMRCYLLSYAGGRPVRVA